MSLLLEKPLNLGKSLLPFLGCIALIQEPGVWECTVASRKAFWKLGYTQKLEVKISSSSPGHVFSSVKDTWMLLIQKEG